MTDAKIRCFLSAAKHASFSRAAFELGISQPAVSKQIAQMEAELGITLFVRTGNAIALTEAGRLLYTFYDGYVTELETVLHEARGLQSARAGTVRVGCLSGWSISEFFPRIEGFFAREHPEIKLTLTALGMREAAEALRTGRVDVMLSYASNLEGKRGIDVRRFTTLDEILLFSRGHGGRAGAAPGLEDFRDDIFYMTSEESIQVFGESIRRCEAAGFYPKLEIQPDLSSILLGIQAGHGVMFADTWFRERYNSNYGYLVTGGAHRISAGWPGRRENSLRSVFVDELLYIFHDPLAGQ